MDIKEKGLKGAPCSMDYFGNFSNLLIMVRYGKENTPNE